VSKPSAETIQTLKDIQTEIGAGMVLIPRSEADHAHNNACNRANQIIRCYAEGQGLFQMTRQMEGRSVRAPKRVSKPKKERTDEERSTGV
jgi:hypothetical protein